MDPRRAYLELLKRALCDLLGPRPLTAVPQPGGTVAFEPLPVADLEKRETGADWPANATTMVGLRRLDQLQECVETVVGDGVEGGLIETGVWRGGASILMRATLASLGVDDRKV